MSFFKSEQKPKSEISKKGAETVTTYHNCKTAVAAKEEAQKSLLEMDIQFDKEKFFAPKVTEITEQEYLENTSKAGDNQIAATGYVNFNENDEFVTTDDVVFNVASIINFGSVREFSESELKQIREFMNSSEADHKYNHSLKVICSIMEHCYKQLDLDSCLDIELCQVALAEYPDTKSMLSSCFDTLDGNDIGLDESYIELIEKQFEQVDIEEEEAKSVDWQSPIRKALKSHPDFENIADKNDFVITLSAHLSTLSAVSDVKEKVSLVVEHIEAMKEIDELIEFSNLESSLSQYLEFDGDFKKEATEKEETKFKHQDIADAIKTRLDRRDVPATDPEIKLIYESFDKQITDKTNIGFLCSMIISARRCNVLFHELSVCQMVMQAEKDPEQGDQITSAQKRLSVRFGDDENAVVAENHDSVAHEEESDASAPFEITDKWQKVVFDSLAGLDSEYSITAEQYEEAGEKLCAVFDEFNEHVGSFNEEATIQNLLNVDWDNANECCKAYLNLRCVRALVRENVESNAEENEETDFVETQESEELPEFVQCADVEMMRKEIEEADQGYSAKSIFADEYKEARNLIHESTESRGHWGASFEFIKQVMRGDLVKGNTLTPDVIAGILAYGYREIESMGHELFDLELCTPHKSVERFYMPLLKRYVAGEIKLDSNNEPDYIQYADVEMMRNDIKETELEEKITEQNNGKSSVDAPAHKENEAEPEKETPVSQDDEYCANGDVSADLDGCANGISDLLDLPDFDDEVEEIERKLLDESNSSFDRQLAELNAKIDALELGESLIIDDLKNELYHASNGYSKSSLDLINQDPSLLEWSKNCPVDLEKTKTFDVGSAFHTLVLEPHKFENEYVVEMPVLNEKGEPTTKTSKFWKEQNAKFLEEHKGKVIITHDENRYVNFMKGSVDAHPRAKAIFSNPDGKAEVSIYWRDPQSGIVFKIRPDHISKFNGVHFITDLKSTADVDDFEWSVGDYRYHVQDALYSWVYTNAVGVEPVFSFCATSKKISCGKYKTRLIVLPEEVKEKGEEKRISNIQTLIGCIETGNWGGFEEAQFTSAQQRSL